MKIYAIGGMHCSACKERIEKSVSQIKGVENVSVNIMTNTMNLDGKYDEKEIIETIKKLGYEIKDKKTQNKNTDKKESTTKSTLISVFLLCMLMTISMGYMIGIKTPVKLNLVMQVILSTIILARHKKMLKNGLKSFLTRSLNMDTLITLGSGISFIYSLTTLAWIFIHKIPLTHETLHALYFESAAMIVTFVGIGKTLEERTKGKVGEALTKLQKIIPAKATIIKNDKEIKINADELKKGDTFIVKTGENVPADGTVIDGKAILDESRLTGESIGNLKEKGKKVLCATTVTQGYIICKAENTGENTTLQKIIKLVNETASKKAPIAKIADKTARIFVPSIIILSIIIFIIWYTIDANIANASERAISVLVISCPCALGLATPVAIMAGSGKALKKGILFKNSKALQESGKTKKIIFDKTGTITKGKLKVVEINAYKNDKRELLEKVASIEKRSIHPIAQAIIKYANEKNIETIKTENFKEKIGNGTKATINGKEIRIGKRKYIEEKTKIPEKEIKNADEKAKKGKILIYISENDEYIGTITLQDEIKENAKETINELKKMKITPILLSGDKKETVENVAKTVGIQKYEGELLPHEKAEKIKEMKDKTMMIGDGTNDAPSLVAADIGTAIGKGTDIAIESADIVLLKDDLKDIVKAIKISRKTLKTIKENLFFAFIYNILLIPVAGGILAPFGINIKPMWASLAMSLSSITVVMNALRLYGANEKENYKEKESKKEETKEKIKRKEEKKMQKIIKIEGMMCAHCENTVKKALEKIENIEKATVSHEKGTATIEIKKEIQNEKIKKAIEDKDYKVVEIKEN